MEEAAWSREPDRVSPAIIRNIITSSFDRHGRGIGCGKSSARLAGKTFTGNVFSCHAAGGGVSED